MEFNQTLTLILIMLEREREGGKEGRKEGVEESVAGEEEEDKVKNRWCLGGHVAEEDGSVGIFEGSDWMHYCTFLRTSFLDAFFGQVLSFHHESGSPKVVLRRVLVRT